MKRLSSIILLALVSLVASHSAHAQMVSPISLGLRGTADGGGVTGKFFLHNNWAIEAQLNGSMGTGYVDNDGASITAVGLLEYNFILPDPSWRIFVGPGVHMGTWDRYSNGNSYETNYHNTQGIAGVDGIVGVEYIFKMVPVGISADIKPAINFAPDVAFFPNNFMGLSARYYFGGAMVRQHRPMREADTRN